MPPTKNIIKRKKRAIHSKDSEEKNLEELVFGKLSDEEVELSETSPNSEVKNVVQRPAWVDVDDDIKLSEAPTHKRKKSGNSETSYLEVLKNKHNRINATPEWAKLIKPEEKNEDDSDDDILNHAGYHRSRAVTLSPGIVKFKLCSDLNMTSKQEGQIIRSIEFHPKSPAALVAGQSGIVTLFQVGGKNNKIQSLHLENFPLQCCHFSIGGRRIIMGSNQYTHFYYYDLTAGQSVKVPGIMGLKNVNMKKFFLSPSGSVIVVVGNHGFLYLLSSESYELIDTLKVSGEVTGVTFTREGETMYTCGDSGCVYVWDMNTRSCINSFHDDGCLKGTCIDLSSSGQLLACGCSSGVVNVYRTDKLHSNPEPAHSIMSLVTPVTGVEFNPTSEILSIMSGYKEGALRLVHFPSATTFKNFPGPKGLARPQCENFSPRSGYLAVGNNKGRALLYRLQHYSEY